MPILGGATHLGEVGSPSHPVRTSPEPIPQSAPPSIPGPASQQPPAQSSPRVSSSGRPIRSTALHTTSYAHTANALYSRRDDGAYVRLACIATRLETRYFSNNGICQSLSRLACPACQRWQFANMQGFINHCRLKHEMEFPSHSEAARACGAVVVSFPESFTLT
ncbi:uncharacterized protein EV422DRAFT_337011 [Fimicolochytrium jonesii]|uniref:uncharacterized protein n=1 Tax=Fimicolochytrium jonesii TaxID=1396493 RepID=UPI0022FEFFAC|nr:uncharacterized protein EV422DRAFT_337011 [Fimicolochytrium jonesii]KAI8815957.1 hypothetical protein EV422DRAFT_337011 [Fimicolochytrium jonesii]